MLILIKESLRSRLPIFQSVYFTLAAVTAFATLRADLRRRRLALTRFTGWHLLTGLDVASTVLAVTIAAALLVMLIRIAISEAVVPLRSPLTFGVLVSSAALVFLWREGLRQAQFQRPRGILYAETLILGGVFVSLASMLFRTFPGAVIGPLTASLSISAILLGCGVLVWIVPPFIKKGAEYHRILDHIQEQGESVQEEYTPRTPECPNPQLWHMADSQSTELEVLDFLKALVTTVKPQLIVETGTFLGYGTIALAQGLKVNGFGRIITIEYDPVIYAKAKERIKASGLADWVESRNESSTETTINGRIDLLFSDSAIVVREQEIRRLLPQISSRGLIAIHDAGSHFKIVRDLALRMEQEGLMSVVMLPTPRGLVIAQKREGRT
jgi:predicted O-methyltransferase YrrM